MPKLPDKTQLGGLSDIRGRSVARITDDAPISRISESGLSSLGTGLGNLGEGLQRRAQYELAAEKKAKHADDSADVLRAEAYKKPHALALERSFEDDPKTDEYDLRFTNGINPINTDAAEFIRNPKLREKWLLKEAISDAGVKDRILQKGAARQQQAQQVEVEDLLKFHHDRFTDPEVDEKGKTQALREIQGALAMAKNTGIYTPQQLAQMSDKYIAGTIYDEVETRKFTDPSGVKRDLLGEPPGAPEADGGLLEPATIDLKQRPLVQNPDGTISTVKSIGVNIDGREILLPTITEDGKMMTGSTKSITDQAVAQYKKTGQHLGVFQDARSADAYAKKLSQSQDQWLAKVARYSLLSPEQRARVVDSAETQEKQQLQNNLWSVKQALESDILSRERNGKVNGELDLATAKKTVEPSVWNNYVERAQVADLTYEVNQGINDMTPVALAEHLKKQQAKIVPGAGDYAIKAKVADNLGKKILSMRDERLKDPALAADKTSWVAPQLVDIDPDNKEQMAALIKGRMEAQQRLAVPEPNRSPITIAEAKYLRDQWLQPDDDNLENSLDEVKALATDVKEKYGEEYSGLIVRKVIEQTVKDKDERAAFIAGMQGLEEEGYLSRTTLRTMRERRDLGAVQQQLSPGGKDAAEESGGGWFDWLIPKELKGDSAAAKPRKTPSKAAIDNLKNKPETAKQFEEWYGLPAGGAQRYLLD